MHEGASLQVDGKAFPEDYYGAALETPENAGTSEKFWGRGWELAGKVLTLRSLTECMPPDNGRRKPENRRAAAPSASYFLYYIFFFTPKNL